MIIDDNSYKKDDLIVRVEIFRNRLHKAYQWKSLII